jgi:ATP-dependent helicase/nuclease subunit A
VASTTSKFNDAESKSSVAYSTKYGLGFKYYDEDLKQKFSTISREVILDDIKKSALEEELRLLYVAMTRAQDKLLFVSSYKNFEKTLDSFKNLLLSSAGVINSALFARTKSYADWLLLSVLLHPCGRKLVELDDNILSLETDSKINVRVINAENLTANVVIEEAEEIKENTDIIDALKQNFEYEYPYNALKNIQTKISVSVLANKAESDKYSFTAKPAFMSVNGVSGAGYGTAMHKVMEFFDFANFDDVEAEIERLCEWQFISEEERNAISIEGLKKFFASSIFARIKASNRVEREMRFITEISAKKLDSTLSNTFNDEKVIVQGAVDVCFIENNEIVILDFKTDRVNDINELALSYGEQLSIYASACQEILGLKVKEKVIYSFFKGDSITIK